MSKQRAKLYERKYLNDELNVQFLDLQLFLSHGICEGETSLQAARVYYHRRLLIFAIPRGYQCVARFFSRSRISDREGEEELIKGDFGVDHRNSHSLDEGNSRSCYFTSTFPERVVSYRSSWLILLLQLTCPQCGATAED
ncbi:hypothetical protein EVAR_53913_1 [Eumeta japonica]|uniref:Uncharacterized protein n=1 Tax=Eumeta variegata TaxID=151549 RepID=A0A4C1YHK1_EUMVA|nr:hypothetical protein EVAR_53913_1 [Eumeta japonica]